MIRASQALLLWLLFLTSGLAAWYGCSESAAPITLSTGPTPRRAASLFQTVLTNQTRSENLPKDGDWPGDFGDANYYGPGFFFRYGAAADNPLQLDLARQSHRHNMALTKLSLTQLGVLIDRMEEVLMAVFGLMEGVSHLKDTAASEQVDDFLDLLEGFGQTFDFYPAEGLFSSGYGLTTYGASAVNASLALLFLEYAENVGGTRKGARIDTACEILEKGYQAGFDEVLGRYRFSPDRPGLFLYPNVSQMIAHLRAYQLTGTPLYLERAKQLYLAIQPLKVAGEGRYRSPYSAEHMGAASDDYSTLSSQSFVLLALSLLYQITAEARLIQEVDNLLAFIQSHLLVDDRVLHHWMDGLVARPEDPEYYCSGCNLQLLYIIWRMESFLGP